MQDPADLLPEVGLLPVLVLFLLIAIALLTTSPSAPCPEPPMKTTASFFAINKSL
jgi:hypothetical protein